METSIGINFAVKRFTSSKDKDFVKALMIYNDTIPVDTKTSTSEIIYFADHAADQPKREMYFFGLYADGAVVGFVEAGYLLTTKTIIIDYIVLKDSFRLNSIFYPLFSLIQRYFSEHMVDYDYIATEVSTKCPEQSVDTESFFSKKMLQMEDFRIVDALYRQPQLGVDNLESNFDFQLMVRSTQSIAVLKKETYLAIVYDIYFEHYYPWYDVADHEHSDMYLNHLKAEYEMIKKNVDQVDGDTVSLSYQTPSCEYYKAPDCHFNNSTAGFTPRTHTKKPFLLLGIPVIALCSFGVALLIYYILNQMNIQPDKFAGIFAAITAVCTALFTLVFTKVSKSS